MNMTDAILHCVSTCAQLAAVALLCVLCAGLALIGLGRVIALLGRLLSRLGERLRRGAGRKGG